MIRLADAFLLAKTKLNSRKVRLIVTIIVAGLMFIGLFLASLIFNGGMQSIEKFGEDGFGKRYITKLESDPYNETFAVMSDPSLVSDIKQADKNLVAAKTAEAKRVGIDYDPRSENLSLNEQIKTPDGKLVATETPQSQSLVRAKKAENSKQFFNDINSVEKSYKVINSFWLVSLSNTYFGTTSQGLDMTTMSLVIDGKETSADASGFSNYGPQNSTGLKSFTSGLNAASSGLLEAFLLPAQTLKSDVDQSIPVIAPYTAAEEALGLSKLPPGSSPSAKLDRLKQVRSKAAGITFQVCMRNSTSMSRQAEAQSTAEQIEKNKTNKEYVKPELILTKSDQPCQDVVVTRDARSYETKTYDQKREQFNLKFGQQPPKQRLVSFKIAGIAPDPPDYTGAFSVSSMLSSLLVSNLGSGWFMPLESKDKLPEFSDVFDQVGKINQFSINRLLEFDSADEARRFNKEKSCDMGGSFVDPKESLERCKQRGTPFFPSGFGSNSVALESAKKSFSKGFYRFALIISAVSIIITMGTIGKVIADSRRETAVFRAIGAKRSDIAQVYILYALMLGLIVVVFAFGAAWALATIAESKYSSSMTISALTAFNSTNLSRKFVLVGVDVNQLLLLVGLILSGALLSSVGPLVANLKRNPIKDMRDER